MSPSNQWLDQITTPFNACSLETSHPPMKNDEDLAIPLIIGCYQLNESGDTRSGELRLYTLRNDENNVCFGEPHHVVNMESGVLDGKWKSIGEKRLFASACASGRVYLHSLGFDSDTKSWRLDHVTSSPVEDGDASALCLSLAWDHSDAASNMIISSHSDGKIALHNVSHSNGDGMKQQMIIEECQRWDAHSMFGCPSEVWTCSFLRGDENVVMSGADDCTLKIWDVRQTTKPTHTISNEFEAGVTAVSPHPSIEHLFAAGSYDEYVRLYDCRILKEPLWKVHVGGGVWRIKWHPACTGGNDKLLVAAMHGGCRVLDCNGLSETSHGSAEIIASFTAHESMAYGADWILFNGRNSISEAAASCSFYDRQAFLWSPESCQVKPSDESK